MADFDTFFQQEEHRSRLSQNRENSPRPARSYGSYTTTGVGEIQVADVFAFDCSFIGEPAFISGVSLEETIADTGENAPDLVATHFPRVTAGVYRWQLDVKGLYIGAWLFFVVDTSTPFSTVLSAEPQYILHHTLAFEGMAVKDLPGYLLDTLAK